ncbi:AAA family ATPase [Glaciimonas soli]|nr:ATP-binding protein [Glaciimonas soli]
MTAQVSPMLHLICGKIASGKSTLAHRLGAEPKTVLISEDEWLSQLFPGEIASLQDYVRCTARLRGLMGIHVEHLLRTGISVVLDFPANTLDSRQWMRNIFESAGSAHCLHYLDVADEECKRRLRRRNDDGSHRFTTSEAEFDAISRYFIVPSSEEDFNVLKE